MVGLDDRFYGEGNVFNALEDTLTPVAASIVSQSIETLGPS